ncbi:hypothetical protein [Winslowiella iniecta]|uniref:MrpH family fimbial adhesin n=1 Tax=Winslowiella iniecta TaxID=1560201 RepID=UPI00069DD46A|nr:hypothetical protein [Winslowiella iniecta]
MFIKLVRALILLLTVLAQQVMAGAYVFPLSFNNLQVVHRLVGWEENEIDLNPCFKWPSCYVGLDVMYRSHAPSMYSSCALNNNCIRIERLRTRKEVMEAWRQAKGIPYTGVFNVESRQATCVGMFYIDQPQHPTPETRTAVKFPGSVCGELPPENQSCHIVLPLEINFGVLNSLQINDTAQEVTGYLYCSLAGTVSVFAESLLGERQIYFDGARRNFYSTLTINNQDAWDGVTFTLPGNNKRQSFTLKAALGAKEMPEAGKYSASGIVYVSYL